MLPYTTYRFIFPPRPSTKIMPGMLSFYENRGWIAQKKKNGTNTVIFAKGDKVIFKCRDGTSHKLWEPQEDHLNVFRGRDKWNVWCSELLHSKVAGGPKHTLFVFDQIVRDGQILIGETFADRYARMFDQFGGHNLAATDDAFFIDKRVMLARNFKVGFRQMFEHLKKEDEGLVLKNPAGRLGMMSKIENNGAWQVKCRIAHANYSF